MKRRVIAVVGPVVLCLLFVALGASVASAASPAPPPSPVAQGLREQIHREGWGRVLVQLRTPAARAHVPEGALSSQAAVAMQRADIVTAQGTVLSRLSGSAHRVLHRYASVPYLALEVGPDALHELEAEGFHVARVVEDQILFPMLPGSVPLIQADQVWARGYDGTGTVIAMIDTGVELSHQFIHGKVVDNNGDWVGNAELQMFQVVTDLSLCTQVVNPPAGCPIPPVLQGAGASDMIDGTVRLTLPRR